MSSRNIVRGGEVSETMRQHAKSLRKAMTPEEHILWNYLRTNRLSGYHFRRQQAIGAFVVDFYCHAAGLVIELDGGIHEQQAEYDAERDSLLSARGLRVMRIPNDRIHNDLYDVLGEIEQAIKDSQQC